MSDRGLLAVPVKKAFDDRLSELHVHRLWRSVQVGRVKRRTVSLSRATGIALATATVLVLGFWLFAPSSVGSLRLVDGRDVPATIAPDAALTVSFNDGSRLDVRDHARLDVLESSGHVFGMALRQGTSEFEVQPGGPRSWRIECGGVTVEVVGTHFVLQRSPTLLRVTVERGIVLVRGPRVPDGVVRLVAGQSISVPLVDETEKAVLPGFVGPSPTSSGLAAPPSASPKISTATPATPANSVAAAPRAEASAPLAPAVAPSASAVPSDMTSLLAEADAARSASHYEEAAALLEQSLAKYAGDPRAPLAEFSLGRLYLDSLSDAHRAADHFGRALSGHLPAGLVEDAQARLVEAFARSGSLEKASNAAAHYRALYPAGRRLVDVDRWSPPVR